MKLCLYGSKESLEHPDLSLTDVFKDILVADKRIIRFEFAPMEMPSGFVLASSEVQERGPSVCHMGLWDTASSLAIYARQSCLL